MSQWPAGSNPASRSQIILANYLGKLSRQIVFPTLHEERAMSKEQLLRQAENAERHADQTTDETVREILRKAADDYRHEAEEEN
jgi:hypothetical protein